MRVLICFAILLIGTGCTTEQLQAINEALAEANKSMQEANQTILSSPYRSGSKLMLFGGRNNEVYLGCLDCSEYAQDSIANTYGEYGSQFSSESIFNSFSDYGSRYSQYSACNPYASSPPAAVDSNGNFYGYLTLNATKQKSQSNWPTIYEWLEDEVCS
ncbi:MAG: hypothetical protein ACE37D_11560 [Pseudomonadales bacterium]